MYLGFSHFLMKWQQNTLIESDVKGSITIPKFKNCNAAGVPTPGPLKIGITAHFEQDGDFQITAKPTTDLRFCLPDTLVVKVNDLARHRPLTPTLSPEYRGEGVCHFILPRASYFASNSAMLAVWPCMKF